MEEITVQVNVSQQEYKIYIGYNILDTVIKHITQSPYGNRYAVITDSTVKTLHAENFAAKMKKYNNDVLLFDFPAGEIYKTRETKQMLDDFLLDNRFGRDSAIIAFGGGVVGDVAGFVAATFMRGIPYIQVPTTTIAQADSSIGGKTAVDYPQGKNLIGAFHHPCSVFIDTITLATLDERNFTSGLIEVIKHGLIRDKNLFDFFNRNSEYILSRDHSEHARTMTDLMRKNCTIKNEIVAKDAKENNLRKILNYGHTIGHAIEHLSGYSLLHGEAIAVGIATEAFFSYKLGLSSHEDYIEQRNIIKKIHLPVTIPGEIKNEDIMKLMLLDKKAKAKQPEFVLLKQIGETFLFEGGKTTTPIPEADVMSLLKEFRQTKS
ncbi:MAG: 3-dehydroquinate synthase [Spirochaetales bacterium]|nr:3-dehydroquinate synthase [Spirochaetales bacterium]